MEKTMAKAVRGRGKPAVSRNSNRQSWQLQDAKAQFSELFRRAQAEGPQFVTRQGKDTVVILTAEEFERLTARARQPRSLVQFFSESPLAGVELDLERPRDLGRKVRL
jgi:antitoxin Phd